MGSLSSILTWSGGVVPLDLKDFCFFFSASNHEGTLDLTVPPLATLLRRLCREEIDEVEDLNEELEAGFKEEELEEAGEMVGDLSLLGLELA